MEIISEQEKMTINFKQKIEAHQQGTYDFTGELVNLALSPSTFKTTMTVTYHEISVKYYDTDLDHEIEEIRHLPRWRASYSEGKTYEEKLARNFKVMISRFTKKANSKRNTVLLEGTQAVLLDINKDRLHYIYSTLVHYGYHCYKDDFDSLPLTKIYKAIERNEGVFERCDFRDTIKPFIDILPSINREKERLKNIYIPLIEQAINDILPKVDLERTERDIIAFIAVSVRNAVSRSITKELKTKVHQIDGKKYYLTVEQIRAAKFNKIKANTILQVDTSKLSANQYMFYDMLCNRIEDEIKSLNTDPFTFNEHGEPIKINKRYFADKMGMSESAFKHRLRRITREIV